MTDEAQERRLEREAQTVFLGEMGDKTTATDTARVEVSWAEDVERPSTEHAGYYIVHVRCPEALPPEGDALDYHPANLAADAVHARSRFRDCEYFSVDDVTAHY